MATLPALRAWWRPVVGWICVLALFIQYIVRPLLALVGILLGHQWQMVSVVDNDLWQLVFIMLGLGGFRSYEKAKGVA